MWYELPSVEAKSVGGNKAVSAVAVAGVGEGSEGSDGGGEVRGTGSSSNSVDGSSLGLSGGDQVLRSRYASPVRVLVEVPVGLSHLTHCFSVVLDDGLGGTSLAFPDGAGGVLCGDGGVDGGGLYVTGVGAVHQGGDQPSGGIAEDGNESDLKY